MKSTRRYLSIFSLVVMIFSGSRIALSDVDEPSTGISVHYDIRLTVEGKSSQLKRKFLVAEGQTFPVEFQRHRIDVEISRLGGDMFGADIRFFAKIEDAEMAKIHGDYYQVVLRPWKLRACNGCTASFRTTVDEVDVDIRVIISEP